MLKILFAVCAATFGQDTSSSRALRQALIIENVGQFPDQVLYQIRQGGDTLWITQESLWFSKAVASGLVDLRLDFHRANPFAIRVTGHSPTRLSYSLGIDPGDWRPDVPVYTGLRFQQIYEGVDLEISAEQGMLEWRWMVGRGAK